MHKSSAISAEDTLVAGVAVMSEVDRLHYVVETQRLIMSAALDSKGAMRTVVERLQALTGADGAAIALDDDNDLELRIAHRAGDHQGTSRGSAQLTFAALCARQGVPLLCLDTETDPRVDRDACRLAGRRSMMAAPLNQGGRTVGVLEAFSATPGCFDNADVDVLELMAGFVSASLTDSARYELDARSALYDNLTGLASRALLMDRLTQVVYEARRYGRSFGVFFVDLDGFAGINQVLGREAGNAVLRAVSRGLSATVRTGDTLARIGGDQFVIVCGNADRSVEERIRSRIETVFDKAREELELKGLELQASIGVLWSTGDEVTADNLLSAAMASMYRVKRQHAGVAG